MKTRWLFILSAVGVLAACATAYFNSVTVGAQPPVFNPASNPYPEGIYAEAIVESVQGSGENVNMYPEVAGTVKQIFVHEGQLVTKGTPLILIDDSIQREIVGQQHSQAQAAHAMLEELKAEPRKEALDVNIAQVQAAQASLKTARDELDKQQAAYTQGNDPVITLGNGDPHLNVRCYVDEILVSRLPPPSKIKAQMTIRGTNIHVPLTFERIQPYVSPKIELSDQRQERVDVRVLPIIFRMERPKNVGLYPGELVDVYIGQ